MTGQSSFNGSQAKTDQTQNGQTQNDTFAGFAAELLNTRECRNALKSLLSETLRLWATESTAKKAVAKPVRWAIHRGISTSGAHPDLSGFLKNASATDIAGESIPVLASSLIEILHSIILGAEALPDEKKADFISKLVSGIDPGKIGEIITSAARSAGDLSRKSPTFFSDILIPAFRKLIENTDFGELKAFFDDAGHDFQSLIKQINDLAFEFPAKLITLLSFFPGISNHLCFFAEDLLKRFNTMPPDVLADILISFFKELDGKTAGTLINNLNEMIRQINTGSALIGDAGAPLFKTELKKKMKLVLNEVEPELCFKAFSALSDARESFALTLLDVAAENPDYHALKLRNISANKNSKIRLALSNLELASSCDDSMFKSLAEGVSHLNTYELAEIVNNLCQTANRMHRETPDVLKNLFQEFINTLDLYELEDTLGLLAGDLRETVRPLVRAVAPVVIKEMLGCLESENDGNDDAVDDVRTMLRCFILGNDFKAVSSHNLKSHNFESGNLNSENSGVI